MSNAHSCFWSVLDHPRESTCGPYPEVEQKVQVLCYIAQTHSGCKYNELAHSILGFILKMSREIRNKKKEKERKEHCFNSHCTGDGEGLRWDVSQRLVSPSARRALCLSSHCSGAAALCLSSHCSGAAVGLPCRLG